MNEKLVELKNKYDQISEQLKDEDVIKDIEKLTKLSKEQAKLQPTIILYEEYLEKNQQLLDAKELVNDPEFREIANLEVNELEKQLADLVSKIEQALIPKDINDERNVIVEIRGAAGGDEANIFAGDLFRMYSKFVEKKRWQVEVLNEERGTSGGFTLMQFLVKGENVYSMLKYENGSHRVQRVPVTETQGRVHTSTATVLVIPEAEDSDVEIKSSDVKVDVFRSGGAGGQSVNTTDSAVRLTHLPTGIVVTCQNERSQIRNKEKAMQLLKARIYEVIEKEKNEKEGVERRSKIGTGDRSEKIRTYNYPQNRVTDHRINLTIKQLDRIMEGNLEEIIENLIIEENKKQLMGD